MPSVPASLLHALQPPETAKPAPARILSARALAALRQAPPADAVHALAIARSGPFWFEPFFAATPDQLPVTDDVSLLLWERRDGRCVALLPLVGETGRTVLRVRPERGLRVAWEPDVGQRRRRDEPALALGVDRDPFRAIERAVTIARDTLRTFRRREQKPVPVFIDRLGWCTWDAFYKDVSAAGIREGLQRLVGGGVRPGFLVIDDGWQAVRDDRMVDFAVDATKFPHGLAPVVREAQAEFGVHHVGVWHTLQGYWKGVDPNGPLRARYEIVPCNERSPDFNGWPAQFDTATRDLVAPRDAARFYQDFHRWLAAQGIDFVKVDNQAMIQQFVGAQLPRIGTQTAYQRALQGASAVHFGGAVLHCMSNVSDVLLHLSTGNLWRNSQDYYPAKSDAFQAHFVTWNAYNNVLTAGFAVPDWDMFQTTRSHAAFHAAARAISGGPLTISDAPGHHDFALLRRVCLPDGRVPRWPQPARPARDRLFEDPRRGNRLLKVVNHSKHAGAIALFNVAASGEDTLGDAAITDRFSPADLPDLPGQRFVAVGSESGRVWRLARHGKARVTLPPLRAEVFTVGVEQRGVAALGLADMLNGGAALLAAGWRDAEHFEATLLSGGEAWFHCAEEPARVRVNGRARRMRFDGATGLLRVPLPDAETPVEVNLHFPA